MIIQDLNKISTLILTFQRQTPYFSIITDKIFVVQVSYWLKDIEQEVGAIQAIFEGQTDREMIIGLQPDSWYEVNVLVYNTAGNGPKSDTYPQETERLGTYSVY